MSELSDADWLRGSWEGYSWPDIERRIGAIADRLDAQERVIAQKTALLETLERERNHATVIVGELAALIPLGETIKATATGATMIGWFKGLKAENARLKDLVQKWRDTCTGRHGSQMPCVGRILP